MRYLNKSATKTMNKLVSLLEDGHCKIDNTKGAFMPVHVEEINYIKGFAGHKKVSGPVYSVAHYYEQNGDLCCDPDMTLFKFNGYYVPMTFEMQGSALARYDKAIFQEESGEWKICRILQTDITTFCNTWMRNIKEQQKL